MMEQQLQEHQPAGSAAAPRGSERRRMSATEHTANIGKNLLYLLSDPKSLTQIPRCFPLHDFDEEEHPPAPDFASLRSWSAHPAAPKGQRAVEDANYLALTGDLADVPPPAARPCDLFYVHDSTLTPTEIMPFMPHARLPCWNAPVGGTLDPVLEQVIAKVDEQVDLRVAAGATCFNATCRIYAPRYRQTNVLAFESQTWANFLVRKREAHKAFGLAYSDVRRAFIHFVDDPANADRPFFLASHSQGTLHLVRLLQEEVDCKPHRLRRFVHAYMPGFVVPMSLFTSLRHVRPSSCARDYCSVSSWRTGGRGHLERVSLLLRWTYLADQGWRLAYGPALATNPVSWSSQLDGAPSEEAAYRGAAFPVPSNLDARHAGGATSGLSLRYGHLSRSSQGTLGARVEALTPIHVGPLRARVDALGVTRVPIFPKESLFSLCETDFLLYHDIDFAAFYGNLRKNVAERHEAWCSPQRSRL